MLQIPGETSAMPISAVSYIAAAIEHDVFLPTLTKDKIVLGVWNLKMLLKSKVS